MEQALTFLPPNQRPVALFRLLYTVQNDLGTLEGWRSTIYFDNNGNLFAENSYLPLNPATADNHLSWTTIPTPYTSYFSSWRKVMRWRQWLWDRGAANISIIAIDTSRVHSILSAEAIAVALGYRDEGFDNRRKPSNHRDEYLVYGGIPGYDNAILSVIPGHGSEEFVRVGNLAIGLPWGFLAGLTMSVEDELEMEIAHRTGVWGSLLRDRLIWAMCT